MVYSFSFFVSSKNLLTYRKWPIGVDCQATRPLELEEVYHGFYSVPSPANVHWQEPLWLLTLASVGGGVNMLMSFLHCSFCSERFFFDCYSKAKAEEPRLSNSPSIGHQTTVKRAFFPRVWVNKRITLTFISPTVYVDVCSARLVPLNLTSLKPF